LTGLASTCWASASISGCRRARKRKPLIACAHTIPARDHHCVELARTKGATTAQLSLAWLLTQKSFIVPIPGTGKVKHLLENIGSTKLVLTADDLKEIDEALAGFKVHGGRMNEQ
jgi:aryl-alcohol dehydrogenase-like predicted oxidoreductase